MSALGKFCMWQTLAVSIGMCRCSLWHFDWGPCFQTKLKLGFVDCIFDLILVHGSIFGFCLRSLGNSPASDRQRSGSKHEHEAWKNLPVLHESACTKLFVVCVHEAADNSVW